MDIKQELKDRVLNLKFSGAIDENSDYSGVSFEGVDKIIFDLEELKRLNSTGIQKWIKFLSNVPENVIAVLERCSSPVVNQLNNFPNFIPIKNVKVNSFYAPYYSEDDDKTIYILLEKDEFNGDFTKEPEKKNAQGVILEFDEIPSKYFAFLTRE